MKHMPTALVPGIYDPSVADDEIDVATEDAHAMVLRLAREEGLLVGVSSRRRTWSAAMQRGGGVEGGRRRHYLLRLGRQVPVRELLARVAAAARRRTGRERIAPPLVLRRRSCARQIEAEGVAAYPNECCGIIFGRDVDGGERVVERLEPVRTCSTSRRAVPPLLDRPAGADARRRRRRRRKGRLVLGFYHSHPTIPARPSEYDREHAWPFYSYVIVAIAKRQAGGHDELGAGRARRSSLSGRTIVGSKQRAGRSSHEQTTHIPTRW